MECGYAPSDTKNKQGAKVARRDMPTIFSAMAKLNGRHGRYLRLLPTPLN